MKPSLWPVLLLLCMPARAETCRYAGTASHDGRLVVRTEVTEAAGLVTMDVTLALTATEMWLFDVQYQMHEISTWRGGVLQAVALNTRYGWGGAIKRQQWDVFAATRAGPTLWAGLEGRRVQGKTLAGLQRQHPAFAQHWPPASFGQPWLADYAAAAPERRPDLDLPGPVPSGLRTPLALAFVWSRWLSPEGGGVPMFLPGFKRDARTELAFGAAEAGDGWRRWRTPLRHAALSGAPSSAVVWVSADHHLLQLAFEVHGAQGSAQGLIRPLGCQGIVVPPG